MKRAVQNGVGQWRIKGKYLLVCIVGNDNKRHRLLSFLLPNGGKKERKWSGRDVNMNHTMYIFPERVKFSFPFFFTWRDKDDRNLFIKGWFYSYKATGKSQQQKWSKPGSMSYLKLWFLHTGLYAGRFSINVPYIGHKDTRLPWNKTVYLNRVSFFSSSSYRWHRNSRWLVSSGGEDSMVILSMTFHSF
jgi:hypothetical protein